MHRFPSLALKSRIDARNRGYTLEGGNGEMLASIRKFGPEIKNRCTQEGGNGEKLASIPKSGPEIKNRCTLEGLNGESMHRRWFDSGGKSGC